MSLFRCAEGCGLIWNYPSEKCPYCKGKVKENVKA